MRTTPRATIWMLALAATSPAESNPVVQWAGNDVLSRHGLVFDETGNLYVVGTFGGTTDMDPTDGVDLQSGNFYVTRMNADGSYGWSRTIGTFMDEPRAGIALGSDGRILAAGDFTGTADFDPTGAVDELTAGGNRAAFITGYSPEGTYLGTVVSRPTTSKSWSRSAALRVDSNGNMVLAGRFSGNVDFDPGAGVSPLSGTVDGFVTKLDGEGNHLWSRRFGGPVFDSAYSLVVDAQDNVIVAGEFRGAVDFDFGPGEDIHTATIPRATFVTKLDPDGSYAWTRTWQILAAFDTPVAVDAEGNVYLSGAYSNHFDNFVIDFDPTEGEELRAAADYSQIFIAMLTPTGAYRGTWFMPGTADVASDGSGVFGMDVDPAGRLLLAGELKGTVDFDPWPQQTLRTSSGVNDVFVARLFADGSLDWVRTIGGEGNEAAREVAAGPGRQIALSGFFRRVVDLDPGCAVDARDALKGKAGSFLMMLECIDPTADADGDGIVDLRDTAAFFHCFSDAGSPKSPAVCPRGCYPFDFDQDDDIDLDDYAAFLSALTAD